MQTWREGMKTSSLDSFRNYIGPSDEPWCDWFVFLGQNRDSDVLEQSNFACGLKALGGESKTVEVRSFGHWASGWFELILVDPADEDRVDQAEQMKADIDRYPILDEDDFSRREREACLSWWKTLTLDARVELCQKAEVSVFAARRTASYPYECHEQLCVD